MTFCAFTDNGTRLRNFSFERLPVMDSRYWRERVAKAILLLSPIPWPSHMEKM